MHVVEMTLTAPEQTAVTYCFLQQETGMEPEEYNNAARAQPQQLGQT